MVRLKNRTSVCQVQRSFPFATCRSRPLRARPSAADASRYGALESRVGDRCRLKREQLRRVLAHGLPEVQPDEQTRRRVSAYQSRVTGRLPCGHAQVHEAIRDLRLVHPSRRKTAFDRGRCLLPLISSRAEPFRRPIQSQENRIPKT